MKKAAIFLMVFSAALCLFIYVLYKEDMSRMDKGEPVLFSTWGYDYTPAVEVENDEKIYIEFDDGTVTTRGATINVVNNTESDISFGESYVIEKYQSGIWKTVARSIAENDWNDMLYIVEKNNMAEFRIYWADLYGELESGDYRIVKYYAVDYDLSQLYELYGYFEIK